MAILLKHDAVFLHVPKTGGTWVTAVLADLGLIRCRIVTKHADMARLLDCARHHPGRWLEAAAKAGPAWQSQARRAFKFCFVRHPLSWYESYWAFMSQRGWNAWGVNRRGRVRWHPNAALDGLGDADFNRFVRNVAEREPGFVGRMYASYATDAIDFVGRQERLAEDLIEVLARLGAQADETRIRERGPVNASDRDVGRPRWDEALRREVEKIEAAAITRFGYDSPDSRPYERSRLDAGDATT